MEISSKCLSGCSTDQARLSKLKIKDAMSIPQKRSPPFRVVPTHGNEIELGKNPHVGVARKNDWIAVTFRGYSMTRLSDRSI
jgi:hypothetical protein